VFLHRITLSSPRQQIRSESEAFAQRFCDWLIHSNNLASLTVRVKDISCRNAKETLAVAKKCRLRKRTILPCRAFYSA
jgi:hypothetical protein